MIKKSVGKKLFWIVKNDMLYKDSKKHKANKVNIFGGGEVFLQMMPLLEEEGITINTILDDTLPGEEHSVKSYLARSDFEQEILYCVGYSNMQARFKRFKELKAQGFNILSYIAESSIISLGSHIAGGTIIKQGAIIDNYVEIGECCFINIGSTISHHSFVHDNVFLAPGVNIAGYVKIGEGVFVGTNATIIDHVKVGEYACIAAGAVVIEDVPAYSMVAGNPAVVKKEYLG